MPNLASTSDSYTWRRGIMPRHRRTSNTRSFLTYSYPCMTRRPIRMILSFPSLVFVRSWGIVTLPIRPLLISSGRWIITRRHAGCSRVLLRRMLLMMSRRCWNGSKKNWDSPNCAALKGEMEWWWVLCSSFCCSCCCGGIGDILPWLEIYEDLVQYSISVSLNNVNDPRSNSNGPRTKRKGLVKSTYWVYTIWRYKK